MNGGERTPPGAGSGHEPDQPEPDLPEPGALLAASLVIYGLMGASALVWLWWRARLGALPEQAIGRHGPLLASAVGLFAGVIAANLLNWAAPRVQGLAELLTVARRVFAATGEGVGIAFVLITAVAEELFFRLAVQDAFGLAGSVAAYALLHSSVGGLRWLLVPVLHALLLGGIVQLGFGLLGSTTAHAILDHLCLRRIQSQ